MRNGYNIHTSIVMKSNKAGRMTENPTVISIPSTYIMRNPTFHGEYFFEGAPVVSPRRRGDCSPLLIYQYLPLQSEFLFRFWIEN